MQLIFICIQERKKCPMERKKYFERVLNKKCFDSAQVDTFVPNNLKEKNFIIHSLGFSFLM